jgi:predicted ribosome quality control (RQC) complex YloA/Tae2 family protein
MGLDGFYFTCLAREIREKCIGARVEDLYGDDRKVTYIQFRAPGRTLRLAFSVQAPPFGMYLAERPGGRERDTNVLAQTIKKYIEGLFFVGIRQPSFERWASLDFAATPGGIREYTLHCEFMGRQNDITLTDSQGIILATSRTSHSEARPLYPGGRFLSPPPANKLDPKAIDGRLGVLLNRPQPLVKFLTSAIQGVSPLLAPEICRRAGLYSELLGADIDEAGVLRLTQALAELATSSLAGGTRPVLLGEDKPQDFYWFALGQTPVFREEDSVSSCLEQFLLWQREHGQLSALKESLLAAVNGRLKIQQRKLAKQEEELARAQDNEAYRQIGDTILANLHLVKKGQTRVSVLNPYTGEDIELDIDPALSPQQNANAYYRKHSKYKHAAVKVQERMEDTRSQLAWLESLTWAIDQAGDAGALGEIREEMQENDLIKVQVKRGRPGKVKEEFPTYQAPDGSIVLVGKNNRQNELLTLRHAKPDHIWLHIRDSAGSHVVITDPSPSDRDLEYAAGLAAWFSRARDNAKAEVVYCPVRNVKKIPGAKPGMVQYVNYYSLTVPPHPPGPVSGGV